MIRNALLAAMLAVLLAACVQADEAVSVLDKLPAWGKIAGGATAIMMALLTAARFSEKFFPALHKHVWLRFRGWFPTRKDVMRMTGAQIAELREENKLLFRQLNEAVESLVKAKAPENIVQINVAIAGIKKQLVEQDNRWAFISQRMDLFMEEKTESIGYLDATGALIKANGVFRAVFSRQLSELRGKGWMSSISDLSSTRVRIEFLEMLERAEQGRLTFQIVAHDGLHNVELGMTPMFNPDTDAIVGWKLEAYRRNHHSREQPVAGE